MWKVGDLLESQITFDCYRIVKIDPENNWIRVRLYYETHQVNTRISALKSAGYKKVKLPTSITRIVPTNGSKGRDKFIKSMWSHMK